MSRIKLIVGKRDKDNVPLIDETGNRVNLSKLGCLSEDLILALRLWQEDYDKDSNYHCWGMYSKLSFEREGLRLAQCLAIVLSREIEFSYYSELYQQELRFYN